MRALAYVYDSADRPAHVDAVLDRVAERGDDPRLVDVDDGDREDGRREAALVVRQAVRVGSYPDALYADDGSLTFAPGALVTEAQTGRRTLHVGPDALEALR